MFTDLSTAPLHFIPYGLSERHFPLREIAARLPQLPRSDLVVTVLTGHGNYAGVSVADAPSINPTQLLAAVRTCPGVRGGVIVLGQCFAGLFNYTNAGDDPAAVPLCLIGATNLSASVSQPLELPAVLKKRDGSDGLHQWTANAFVVRFFEWLLTPQDVDGDGRYSLMDAYKHASVRTNEDQCNRQVSNHIDIGTLQLQVLALQEVLKRQLDPNTANLLELDLNAKVKRLQEISQYLYTHQESWVLHARFANAIEFELPPQLQVAKLSPTQEPPAPSPAPTVVQDPPPLPNAPRD